MKRTLPLNQPLGGMSPAITSLLQPLQDLHDAAAWENFRREFFPYDRINLNPGTVGSCSSTVRSAMDSFWNDELHAFPLGQYQRGREVARNVRVLAQQLWPSDLHLSVSGSTTSTMNLIVHTMAFQMFRRSGAPPASPITVMTTLHEHHGGVGGFESHPAFNVIYLEDGIWHNASDFHDAIHQYRPQIIFASHICWTNAWNVPLHFRLKQAKAIDSSILCVVDAAQSLGLVPLPFDCADVVVASTHKWLMGPPGGGLLWLSQNAVACLGALQVNGECFDEEAPGSSAELRGGQDFSLYAGVLGALELFAALGPALVLRRSQWLVGHFIKRLLRYQHGTPAATLPCLTHDPLLGVRTSLQPDMAWNGMVTLAWEGADPYPLYLELNQHGIHVKCIKTQLKNGQMLQHLRLGIPYYESSSRLDVVAAAIARYFKSDGG